MSEPIKMNIFDSVDNTMGADALPKSATSQEALDYMVLVISRRLQRPNAFKGGYLLNQLLGNKSRLTHDVDFSIDDQEAYAEVKRILIEIGNTFKEAGLIEAFRVKETIAPRQSGGIDFYDNTGAKVLGVDVGLHSLQWGTTQYNFNIAPLTGFTVERMLSDKIMAILSRKRFRRTKDLYDLWVITNNFDFDSDLVLQFIANRGDAEWQNIPFSDTVLVEYEKAWNKLILQTPNNGELDKPPFDQVIRRFNIIALTLRDAKNPGFWNHRDLMFREKDNA